MSRYLIGIDLGTTNSAVAFIDTSERLRAGRPTVRRFAIRQMVQPGEFEPRETLPSFLYFPSGDESHLAAASPLAPIVGVYAREHGALVPGRQVASAKSWLCNSAVDRTAAVLPWGHGEDEAACSPVDASARYLSHLRDAWNQAHGDADEPFEHQRIVLTVPASFDEEARELTLQSAREAGFDDVTLLEEPLAAFYAWIASHASSVRRQLHDNNHILICDVGGGTTDFTLIRARTDAANDTARFERTAVGEHLLLGGDNLDLALARRVEAKLPNARLTLRQQQALARLTSAAKERLLTDRGVDRLTIAIPAAGRSLVAGRLAAALTRDEVLETLLDGFLPPVASSDLPARGSSRTGLREFGLPYATEPAITRHLAAFLARAATAEDGPASSLVRPDAILFNGGFFVPQAARDAVVKAVESWFCPAAPEWRLTVLTNRNPATAVASGAAYYGFVRAHGGIRVSGGSARAYYVGLRGPGDAPPGGGAPRVTAVCVLPRGTEEGTTLALPGRLFTIATNRPVAFPLFSSTTRHDALGDVLTLDADEVHEHAPLVTVLRYGKKSRQPELRVRLSARFTEVGTLELWCESAVSEHRWRLQFELRATEQGVAGAVDDAEDEEVRDGSDEGEGTAAVIEEPAIAGAIERIRAVFGPESESAAPESLVTDIEVGFGFGRQAWPLPIIRRLADVMLEVADGRKKAPRYEARWLNLTGFCLRPGFGAALDEWRMDQLRRIYPGGLAFPRELQNQAEWLVLWQRVAGGLTAGQQQELYQRNRAVVGVGGKKDAKRVNPQVEREGWRLLASLERLPASNRASLGSQLLSHVQRQPGNAPLMWALGRFGARIPAYGPLDRVVPATTVAGWIERLLGLGARGGKNADKSSIAAAISQMAARTGDAHRDIGDELRARVITYLQSLGAVADDIARVREYVPPAVADGLRLFGETMPDGLRLHEG